MVSILVWNFCSFVPNLVMFSCNYESVTTATLDAYTSVSSPFKYAFVTILEGVVLENLICLYFCCMFSKLLYF